MKVDFWPGMAAKRASLPTITLASIRKVNFQFAELRLPCQGKNKNRLLGRNGCKWTIPHQRHMLFGKQSLLMRKISLSVFQNERLWQNYSLCLIRFV